ncbi:hypothetical protein [Nannocystis pusilla]|uniref:hypothetical protein n=1 Tax=Nannocystis pusilla TaxID=889268 RepID=UPI003B78DE11
MVEFGPEDDPDYQDAIAACVSAEVEHELMDAAAARERFPIAVPEGGPPASRRRAGTCA